MKYSTLGKIRSPQRKCILIKMHSGELHSTIYHHQLYLKASLPRLLDVAGGNLANSRCGYEQEVNAPKLALNEPAHVVRAVYTMLILAMMLRARPNQRCNAKGTTRSINMFELFENYSG